VIEKPGRHHDAPGEYVLAVYKDDAKAAVAGRGPETNCSGYRDRARRWSLKPGPVIDEIFDRQTARAPAGPFRRNSRRADSGRPDRRYASQIHGERSFHAARHVASPKRHGFRRTRGPRHSLRADARPPARPYGPAPMIATSQLLSGRFTTIFIANWPGVSSVSVERKCSGAGFDFINGSRSDGQNGVIWLRTPGFRGRYRAYRKLSVARAPRIPGDRSGRNGPNTASGTRQQLRLASA